jgi:hypothetical protein
MPANGRDEGGARSASRDSAPAGSVNNVDLGVLDVARLREVSVLDIPGDLERDVSSRLTLMTQDRVRTRREPARPAPLRRGR